MAWYDIDPDDRKCSRCFSRKHEQKECPYAWEACCSNCGMRNHHSAVCGKKNPNAPAQKKEKLENRQSKRSTLVQNSESWTRIQDEESFKALVARKNELEETLRLTREGLASPSPEALSPVSMEEEKTPRWQLLRDDYLTKIDGREPCSRFEHAVRTKNEDELEMLLLELKREGSVLPEGFISTEFTAGVHFRRLSMLHLVIFMVCVFAYQALSYSSTLYLLTPSQCRPYLPSTKAFGIQVSTGVLWIPSPDPDETNLAVLWRSTLDSVSSGVEFAVSVAISGMWNAFSDTYVHLAYRQVRSHLENAGFLWWYWMDPEARLQEVCLPVIENRMSWVFAWSLLSAIYSIYRLWSVTHVRLNKIMAKHVFKFEKLSPVDLLAWQVNNRHPSLRYGKTLEVSEPRLVKHKIRFFVTRSRNYGFFVGISTLVVDLLCEFWLRAEGNGPGFQEADDFWTRVPATAIRGTKNAYHRFSGKNGKPREAREIFGSALGPNLDGKVIDFMKFNAFCRQASIVGCDGFEKMSRNVELAVKTSNWSAENWRASDPSSAMVLMSLTAYQWLAVVHDANPKVRDDIKWSF